MPSQANDQRPTGTDQTPPKKQRVHVVTSDEQRWAALREALERHYHVERTDALADVDAGEGLLVVDGVPDDLEALLVDGTGPLAVVVDDDADPATRRRLLERPSVDVMAGPLDAQEVTLRLRRLDDAARLRTELGRTNAVLTHTSTQLERFAYTASHDLKEPLRAVSGFAKLLQTRHADELSDSAKTYLDFITDGAARLGKMISALLEYSVQSRHEIRRAPVDLADLVERILADLPVEDATVTIGDLPVVHSDQAMLRVLLEALLSNAIRYRAPTGPHRVEVRADPSHNGVTLVVTDTGIGVAPADQTRVFDMFVRLHTREQYPGQGLGLPLAAMIAGRLGGTIDFTSAPDEGTTVTVDLPAGG